MKRKKLRKKVESLRKQIERHREKISEERHMSFPDDGCIAHWETEIAAFEKQVKEALKKLEG